MNTSALTLLAPLACIALVFSTGCPSSDIDEPTPNPTPKTNNRQQPDIGLPDMADMTNDDGGNVDMNGDMVGDIASDMTQTEDMNTMDMSTEDMQDMPEDMPQAQGCRDIIKYNTTFELDNSGVIPHYYGRAAYDGTGVWMTYVRPQSATVRDMNVYALKLNCDGTIAVPSFQVNSISNSKDMHSSIAIGESSVFIAWTKEQDNNVHHVYMRAFAFDGTPHTSSAKNVTPLDVDNTNNISKLIWETDIAALPGDRAVVVASYFADESGSFQTVAQRIDKLGERVGPALFPKKDKGVDQTRPSVAALADGTIYVAYTRAKGAVNGMPAIEPRVVYAKFAPNAVSPDPAGPFPANPGSVAQNDIGRYSKEQLPSGEVYLAIQTGENNNILVKDGAFGAPLSIATAGDNSRYDHRPSIAAEAGGGAIAWFRANPTPIKNDVYVQSFTNNAGNITLGSINRIPISDFGKPAGNEGANIISLGNGNYFVTWSEGSTSSDAKIKGRFIKF